MGPTFRLDRMIIFGKSAEYGKLVYLPPWRGKGKRSIFNLRFKTANLIV